MAQLPKLRKFQHGLGVFQPPENELEESSISDEIGKMKKVKISDKNKRRKKGSILNITFTQYLYYQIYFTKNTICAFEFEFL